MPRIEFLASVAGPAAEIDRPEGGSMLEACDEVDAPVPFSCRSTSCGTCRIDVIEGIDLFEEPGEDEREVLELFGDDAKKRRLACTARIKKGPGLVRVRACEDW